MSSVHRDVALFFSGRCDILIGGSASISSRGDSSEYSAVGYAMGFFPDPTRLSPLHYDVGITSQGLGHTCGTRDTHDPPNLSDTCNEPFSTPQRRPFMSHCALTWSGRNANRDLHFHTGVAEGMRSEIDEAEVWRQAC